jgi:hypothetical protein
MQCTVWMDGDKDAVGYSEVRQMSRPQRTWQAIACEGYQRVSLTGSEPERDAPGDPTPGAHSAVGSTTGMSIKSDYGVRVWIGEGARGGD